MLDKGCSDGEWGLSLSLKKLGRGGPEVAMEEEMICRLQVLDTILLLSSVWEAIV